MARPNSYRFVPKDWQRNPDKIKTNRVQFWSNGIMLTAQLTNAEAKEMVRTGKAYVITEQAIGDINKP